LFSNPVTTPPPPPPTHTHAECSPQIATKKTILRKLWNFFNCQFLGEARDSGTPILKQASNGEFLRRHEDAVFVGVNPVPRPEDGAADGDGDVPQAQVPLGALQGVRVEGLYPQGHPADVVRVPDAPVYYNALQEW